MNDEYHQIGAAATRLANRLPHSVMIAVAGSIAQHGGSERSSARQAVLQGVPTPDFRDAAASFLDLWHSRASGVGPEAVAVALVTAARSEQDHRNEETVEIVWTGPEPAETRFRQTEQAILEVVNSATRRLTVVSYAVYRIPRIRDALVAVASRGVGIRLFVETPNRIEGQGEYDRKLHRVRLHHQHGVGGAGYGREVAGAGGAAFREADRGWGLLTGMTEVVGGVDECAMRESSAMGAWTS